MSKYRATVTYEIKKTYVIDARSFDDALAKAEAIKPKELTAVVDTAKVTEIEVSHSLELEHKIIK